MRTAGLALLALVLLVPSLDAATQDPATYPPQVLEVSHSPVVGDEDFDVTVVLADAADRVTVTVCRFTSVDADAPEVCYMNLGAARSGEAWLASTGAVDHPAWRDGWVLGYKVAVKTPSAEVHAPDRLAASGEPDYYRLVVGEPEEPVPQGSAVVEDSPPVAEGARVEGATQGSPSPGLAAAALALVATALASARRR